MTEQASEPVVNDRPDLAAEIASILDAARSSIFDAVHRARTSALLDAGRAGVEPPLLYRIDEGARTLGLGRSRFWQLLASGEIETVRIGRSRRIPHEALVEYVARLRVASGNAEDAS